MKTEITIGGITYKVGDVLESKDSTIYDQKIVYIGHDVFLTEYPSYYKEALCNSIVSHAMMSNWKIKKPKKKIVIERWINTYKDGSSSTWSSKANADTRPYCKDDRIACEYVRFEYEIDE